MNETLFNAYDEIKQIVKSGRIGNVQVCVFSVNDKNLDDNFFSQLDYELDYASNLFSSKKVVNEDKQFLQTPYMRGYVSREYENGEILRYIFTSANVDTSVTFTVYGTGGEIRYDALTNKVVVFDLIPDHQGERITY